jgi:hypothetical protein
MFKDNFKDMIQEYFNFVECEYVSFHGLSLVLSLRFEFKH